MRASLPEFESVKLLSENDITSSVLFLLHSFYYLKIPPELISNVSEFVKKS